MRRNNRMKGVKVTVCVEAGNVCERGERDAGGLLDECFFFSCIFAHTHDGGLSLRKYKTGKATSQHIKLQ
jgi:hypothetical protein